ncbi:uncharacterized protein [Symphalangus syndactylus]|uniref:uncharacterized protein n=1 Tax=Symphalangus syndactylus TaxID=9590 RepID=UPI002441CEF3|nr:uncharacterized protein LOC129480976 [Symphalangus syndactylus]
MGILRGTPYPLLDLVAAGDPAAEAPESEGLQRGGIVHSARRDWRRRRDFGVRAPPPPQLGQRSESTEAIARWSGGPGEVPLGQQEREAESASQRRGPRVCHSPAPSAGCGGPTTPFR